MTKTVYAYAADGKYIGERKLDDTDRSPVSGAWQIPGNMTEAQPPVAKEGYDIYWRNGKWEMVEHPKPEPEPAPPTAPSEPQELPVDPERLAVYEAMAAQEARLVAQAERITALEAALKVKGGDSK